MSEFPVPGGYKYIHRREEKGELSRGGNSWGRGGQLGGVVAKMEGGI